MKNLKTQLLNEFNTSENLLDILLDGADIIFKEGEDSARFCFFTTEFSEAKALKSLGLKKSEINKCEGIEKWCFDDETIHLTFTSKFWKTLNDCNEESGDWSFIFDN